LAVLDRKLSDEDRSRITEATGGQSPRDLANLLLDAIDVDKQIKVIEQIHGPAPTAEQEAETIDRLIEFACAPFDAAPVRNLLKDIKKKNDIVIDEVTTDEVRSAGFDLRHAEERITSFKTFIEENKDELTALQIIYNQSYGQQRLTYAAIKELVQALTDPPRYLTTADIWQAFKRLDASRVKGAPVDQQLTEVVSLVRFALGYDTVLEPFALRVEQRFNLWIGREKNAGRDYTPEQMTWLRIIAGFIAVNAEIGASDFMDVPSLSDKGGILKARHLFGTGFGALLDELQGALVA
jgi:type I restriction enzyme R subunit